MTEDAGHQPPSMDHGVLLLSDLPHAELAHVSRHIERLDYDAIWYADERFFHEPYVGLAVIAGATERVRIGPAVADPRTRHPALVAAAMNSLADLSGGRAVLAFGAGKSGFHNLGLTTANSATAMREGIDVIRSLLAGQATTLHGDVVTIEAARMRVPPIEVPICVAANGPLTLRLAGAAGDAVMIPHCRSPQLLRHKLAQVAIGAEAAGRSSMPRLILRLDASVGPDGEAARWAAKTRLARTIWAAYPDVEYLRVLGLELPRGLERLLSEAGPFPYSFDLRVYERFVPEIPDELLHPICLAGTSSDVAEQLADLRAEGVDEIAILPVPPPDMTALDVVDHYAVAASLEPSEPRQETRKPR